MWSNYHTHTRYCDGTASPVEIVAQAHELVSLGFSSHAPLPFDCRWCMSTENLDRYLEIVSRLKKECNTIELYAGLEVDFIPDVTGPDRFKEKLDYTIGAVHFVECFLNGDHWEIDGRHSVFLEGLREIFHGDIKEAVSRYYELIQLMVDTSCPTIVAHLDKIKIQNAGNTLFSEQDQWYQDLVNQTLDHIAAAGAIIEVNTRGVYQKKSDTTYPSPWILNNIHKRNIPITLSSDAHHPTNLTTCFAETAHLLYSIGFSELLVLLDGRWQPKKFTADGLVL